MGLAIELKDLMTVVDVGWYPEVIAQAMFAFASYLVIVGPLRRCLGWGEPVQFSRVAWFGLGLGMFVLAEGTPLHDLSERYLLSAHMLQHMLLVFAMPAFLIMGSPPWIFRLTFFRFRPLATGFRFITRPLVAFLGFNAIFALWHVPTFYRAALDVHSVHIVEHASFIFAGGLMWWPLLSPIEEAPRPSYALQLLYIFLLSGSQIAVYGPLTFLERVAYPVYGHGPLIWGLAPIDDQRIAGLIMKIPMMPVFISLFIVIFLRWAAREGK